MDEATQDMLAADEKAGRMTKAEVDLAYAEAAKHHSIGFHRWLDEGGMEQMVEDYREEDKGAGP